MNLMRLLKPIAAKRHRWIFAWITTMLEFTLVRFRFLSGYLLTISEVGPAWTSSVCGSTETIGPPQREPANRK